MLRIRRVYDAAQQDEGARYLVDRLWPRGVTKEGAELDGWARDVAPSAELRRWFGHDPEKRAEFRRRYAAELDANPDAWRPLLDAARRGTITLLFSAKDAERNNAVALGDYLRVKL